MTAKFWITGTGNWSDNTHWSTSTGGANNTTAAGSGDTATFDASSGGGTVTIDADLTMQAMTWGAFTGTIDNSANHNMTFTANGGFNGSGSGARTFTGGTGTYTLSTGSSSVWTMATSTNLTNPTTAFSSATITMSAVGTSAGTPQFIAGALTYGTVNLNANKGVAMGNSSFTVGTFNVTGPNGLRFPQGQTITITNAFAWTGTSSTPIYVSNGNPGAGITTITTGSGTTNTAAWAAFEHITFTPVGGSTLTATNSLDLGLNTGTGFTITAPSAGGGGISKARIGSGF